MFLSGYPFNILCCQYVCGIKPWRIGEMASLNGRDHTNRKQHIELEGKLYSPLHFDGMMGTNDSFIFSLCRFQLYHYISTSLQ